MTPAEPELGEGYVIATKPEVVCPAPSWNPAGAILPRGLVILMGTTCVDLGGSPLWLGRVTCPPGVGYVTPAEPEVWDGSSDCLQTGSGCRSSSCHRTGSVGS